MLRLCKRSARWRAIFKGYSRRQTSGGILSARSNYFAPRPHYDNALKTTDYRIPCLESRLLSRFRTKKQQAWNNWKDKKRPSGYWLIGTHRFYAKDIEFQDLGLLIVDENNDLVWKTKEKLNQFKSLKSDVLTLTATPYQEHCICLC